MLREALSIQQQALEADNWEIAETQLRLGQLLMLKNELEEADALLKQSNVNLTRQFGEENKLVKQARESLASLNNLR